MNRLYYLGKPDDGYGWGIANTNLVRELGKLCEVIVDTSGRERFDAPVFVPVSDAALNPIRKVKAPRVIGYCFTEWPIEFHARENAKQFDVLFAGSTWNVERLAAQGIKSEVLIQGVDFDRFTVQGPSQRAGFVVFSGGKLEFRKGQDYVIAAMRHFMRFHGDAVLIAPWHNPWPQSQQSMRNSWLVDYDNLFDGLPMDRVFALPAIANHKLAELYAQAHIGLFPNRCEAGTNMVMCEFMASARPVIATHATGHRDVFAALNGVPGPYLLGNGSTDPAGWFNTNVSDVLHALEHAYSNRAALPVRGTVCRQLVERFTWSDCARKIAHAAFPPGK